MAKRKSKNRIILEFMDFNNSLAVGVTNPSLSTNNYDRHVDAIRSGMIRLRDISRSLSSSSAFSLLKSKFNLDNQNITDLKVLRILSNYSTYDVYITFTIEGEEYWGVIYDIMNEYPIFKSEVFKDSELILTKEWIIKIKGRIIKEIKNWLYSPIGEYKLMKENIYCYSTTTGSGKKLSMNDIIEVKRCYDGKIIILFEHEYYQLTNDEFIYFNYWFEKI